MRRKLRLCALVWGLTALLCVCLGAVQLASVPRQARYIDHIVNAGADPTLGTTTIPEDRMVGGEFVSHLPLVVIDTGGQEIVSYKQYNPETDAFEVPAGIDPYFSMTLSVYDSADHCNRLSDPAGLVTTGRIKVRGNSSSFPSLPKFQYKLKLNEAESVMGIGTDDTWVLSPTVQDKSQLRNYLVYNIAGQIKPFTPDLRYCEVLFAREGGYYYGGLYRLCESVKVSPERVDIRKDATGYHVGSGYLLLRDRYSDSKIILDTWGTRMGYNCRVDSTQGKRIPTYFSLEYPKNENATPEVIASIEEEISEIEAILYSGDAAVLEQLDQWVDLNSFAEYMVINEFFTNYDAGTNSTFLYKAPHGKLTAGPYWDYDGAVDNWNSALLDINAFAFPEYPWYNALIRLETFERLVEKRYHELRKTILSDEYLDTFIDGTLSYLGNALAREESAYGDYTYLTDVLTEQTTGLTIDRRRETAAEEARRVKDVLHLRGAYMDRNIAALRDLVTFRGSSLATNTVLACVLIAVFLVSTLLARRRLTK